MTAQQRSATCMASGIPPVCSEGWRCPAQASQRASSWTERRCIGRRRAEEKTRTGSSRARPPLSRHNPVTPAERNHRFNTQKENTSHLLLRLAKRKDKEGMHGSNKQPSWFQMLSCMIHRVIHIVLLGPDFKLVSFCFQSCSCSRLKLWLAPKQTSVVRNVPSICLNSTSLWSK